jgi:hypothetical protein
MAMPTVATRELKTMEMLFHRDGLDLRGFFADDSAVMKFPLLFIYNAQTDVIVIPYPIVVKIPNLKSQIPNKSQ